MGNGKGSEAWHWTWMGRCRVHSAGARRDPSRPVCGHTERGRVSAPHKFENLPLNCALPSKPRVRCALHPSHLIGEALRLQRTGRWKNSSSRAITCLLGSTRSRRRYGVYARQRGLRGRSSASNGRWPQFHPRWPAAPHWQKRRQRCQQLRNSGHQQRRASNRSRDDQHSRIDNVLHSPVLAACRGGFGTIR